MEAQPTERDLSAPFTQRTFSWKISRNRFGRFLGTARFPGNDMTGTACVACVTCGIVTLVFSFGEGEAALKTKVAEARHKGRN